MAEPGRWELLRALGAIASLGGGQRRRIEDALELGALTEEEHTEVFVLECPPYASLHLGPEGKLGGEATDRVAGFLRTLGLAPVQEPDHLATLLDAYAWLGERSCSRTTAEERAAQVRAREALLFEHLWAWVPGYLQAVLELGLATIGPWADLLLRSLEREVAPRCRPSASPWRCGRRRSAGSSQAAGARSSNP